MYIYSKEEIQEADSTAEKRGMPVFTLMETAGRALYEALANTVTRKDSILVLAGKGSNGGDGIVLARYLKQNGFDAALVFPLGEPKADSPADEHLRYFEACGFASAAFSKNAACDVIVDALLGAGSALPLRENAEEIVKWANGKNAMRVAVDLPTGVEADTGNCEEAFRADMTFSLHGYKPSAFLLPSSSYYGKVTVLDIGLPHKGRFKVWTMDDVKRTLPVFPSSAHKGTFGTSYLIAGSEDMPGSVMMAAAAALRSGTGKLMIGTSKTAAGMMAAQVPEATYFFDGLKKAAEGEFPEKIAAVGMGPGLQDKDSITKAIHHLLQTDLPVVLDADALDERDYPDREQPVILTPHPGEFSRMSGYGVKEVQANRIQYASEYAVKHKVTVILKGEHTVIAYPDGTGAVNTIGNSALGKGGSGDTLTGMLTAFLGHYKDSRHAAANAVVLHALTSEEWVKENGLRSMTATDISGLLPRVMKLAET
ncbi:NAD(P)H-hydrate dehydratase [Metabacillus sp. GX 13764]|uniref:NAD(P)H-hydrate dehydratase n=1 Tax=Metabacillus kandeliae TaxID=2900151 RepID=UPI001E5B5DF2|nr:NAD(P)H-hydrate dehydratase [Metabacillus kandeliae]MCD7035617.1 NAD(P)H-hydrate dehydratase [Metabacillus kandeliae]